MANNIQKPFRHSAPFWRRIEYWIIGRMLMNGLDVHVPTVDDHSVDAVVVRDGVNEAVQLVVLLLQFLRFLSNLFLRPLALGDVLKDRYNFAGREFINKVFVPAAQFIILIQSHRMTRRFVGLPNLPKHLDQTELFDAGTNLKDALANQPLPLIVNNPFRGAVKVLENKNITAIIRTRKFRYSGVESVPDRHWQDIFLRDFINKIS